MALSIVILLLAALLLLWFTFRSRYGLPLLMMTLGMCAVSVAVLFQSWSSSMYAPPAYFPFRALDLSLYRSIGSLHLPFTQAQVMRTLGSLLCFGGSLTMTALVFRNMIHDQRLLRAELLTGACCLLFMAAFAVFYSPAMAYRIYLRYYALPAQARPGFRLIMERADLVMRLLTLACLALPAVLLCVQYFRRNTTYFLDSFALLTGLMLLYAVSFYTAFFTGPFAQGTASVFRSGFWYFSDVTRVPARLTVVFSCFALLIPVFILAAANRVFSGDLVLLSRKRAMRNSIEELNRNLRDVFHSEKNLMFSIELLAGEARSAWGTPEGLEKLDRLTEVARSRMEMISSSLRRIRELRLRATPVDLRSLTDRALDDACLPEGVRCEKHYCGAPARCLVDEYHTRSALKNLFDNAVEAMALSGRADPCLTVGVSMSRARVRLTVEDNGTGIARRELKRVMLPFVSSKSKNSNWGIGLPYAFRVINAQLGQMRIVSSDRSGRAFTRVEILLPRERSRE